MNDWPTPDFKHCSKCGQYLPAASFAPKANLRSGLNSWCRECHRAATRRWRTANPDHDLAWNTERRERTAKNKTSRTCLVCGGVIADRRRKDSTVCSAACDRKRDYATIMNNPSRAERYRDQNNQKRARRRGNESSPLDRLAIFNRDKWRCQLCGKTVLKDKKWPHPLMATIDHIIPLALGGKHTAVNAQTAHLRCNVAKHIRKRNEQLLLVG